MAKSQENGIAILLGLEDYGVEEVVGSGSLDSNKGETRKMPLLWFGRAISARFMQAEGSPSYLEQWQKVYLALH